jgi:predicted transcriptional regulator
VQPIDALIKAARKRAGLTQAELARRLAVSQPVVARLERPGANPRLLTLDRVIAATGHGLELSLTSPSGIDESMIAADLKLTPNQRLRNFEAFYGFARDAAPVAEGRGP